MKLITSLFAAFVPCVAMAGLETPQPGASTVQSGISVISGFDCTATQVFVKIDNYPPLAATVGTERNDTVALCGRAQTGFSLLYNYNDLAPGYHSMEVYAKDHDIAYTGFQVQNYGVPFVRGAQARETL